MRPQSPITLQLENPSPPILHHLNADSSWLLQIPCPTATRATRAYQERRRKPQPHKRKYKNLVFDPWLSGPQSDVASWFSSQTHAEPPKIRSIAELEALALLAEEKEAQPGTEASQTSTDNFADDPYQNVNVDANPSANANPPSAIDAILLSHEFTDHTHKATLLSVPASVPVFAAPTAARLVRSWHHFARVIDVPPLTGEGAHWARWGAAIALFHSDTEEEEKEEKEEDTPPTPWLTVARLEDPRDALYYHSALLVTFARPPTTTTTTTTTPSIPSTDPAPACILYTPHGVAPRALEPLLAARPAPQPLALLHGLHDVRIAWGQQLNLGGQNAVAVQQMLGARWWLPTHDEVKIGRGLVSWLLRRRVWGVAELLGGVVGVEGGERGGGTGKEGEEGREGGEGTAAERRKYGFFELRNGERVALD